MDTLVSIFAPPGEKHKALELFVLIILPGLLSGILLRYALRRVALGARRWILWLSLIPLLAGVYLAITPFLDVQKMSYLRFHLVTDRSVTLHYVAFFVPVGLTVVLIGLLLYLGHRDRMER
jgi:hypothetical protein